LNGGRAKFLRAGIPFLFHIGLIRAGWGTPTPRFGSAETVRAIGRDFHPGWAFPSFYPCAPSLTSARVV